MNTNLTPQTKKALTLGAGALLVLVIVLTAIQLVLNARFRITNITPSGTFASSTNTITVEYSKALRGVADQPEFYVTLSPPLAHTTRIVDNTLDILLEDTPEPNTNLTVAITDIRSDQDEQHSETIEYNVLYIPYNELDAAEKARQTQAVGTVESRNPLLSKLPHDEISYRIEYYTTSPEFGTAADWKDEKDNYTVTIQTFTPFFGDIESFRRQTEVVRADALEWIKKQDVNPETDIQIEYDPSDELIDNGLEEFPAEDTGRELVPAGPRTDTEIAPETLEFMNQ